ncbi:MAG TPA: phosphorylase [Candidatus Competibacteraceae bacterium]|nr:phosphorylase [Candidatus Competibacteraceae bacterium]
MKESLSYLLERRSRAALACGALQPIETVCRIVPDAGVRFVVRRVSSLKRRDEARMAGDARPSPYLPPEPELVVGELSSTHFALLNKFNVIDRHLLIVTRRFVPQETLLDGDDFAALALAMAELDGLGFYNGGGEAGASQRHKHLQWVPLPLGEGEAVPMEALLAEAIPGPGAVPGLPFRHAFARLDAGLFADPAAAAQVLHQLYHDLLAHLGISGVSRDGMLWQGAPYNLLVTRRWLLLVPRLREKAQGISINALGFAGSLFVRDAAELARVQAAGPMRLLRDVAGP